METLGVVSFVRDRRSARLDRTVFGRFAGFLIASFSLLLELLFDIALRSLLLFHQKNL